MASDSLCLENLDEFVHDENKIVTCKWLSLTLKIHINQAKRLLHTFLQQQKGKEKEVKATYFLAGLSKGDNGHMEHKCVVVTEEDLESTRSQLSTVTSCHVYSIQKANLKDSNSLYMTDYEGVKENFADCNRYSSIHCKRASLPRKQAPSVKAASPDRSHGAVTAVNGDNKTDAQQKTASDRPSSTGTQGTKGKKAEPKGSIASMFAQSSRKKEPDTVKPKETAAKEETKENKPAARKGGVMDLFANAKPAAKTKAAEEKEKAASKETKTVEKKGPRAAEVKSSKKSRPKEDSDSEELPERKRRRRIKNDLFDSSSEEEIEIDSESPVPSPVQMDSPEPESPLPTPRTPQKQVTAAPEPQEDTTTNGSKSRRRRRKLVPKTYLDEEGFMVTEKVWESESTDASEVEEETKKKAAAPQKKPVPAAAKKNSPQKKASPAKGKQMSLTSFFRKK